MLLGPWMHHQRMSQSALAKEVGISQQMVSLVLAGTRRFSPEVARRIVRISEGAVSLEELLFANRPQAGAGE
jgi:DNA-binding transcriptional regulator YdaS (Cro superfamily)